MTITNKSYTTWLEVWAPRYKDKHGKLAEPVVLLARYKVDAAAPILIIDFTKAKHLRGQRYAITRQNAQKCPLDSNTKIPCYAVPLSKLESWETAAEARDTAFEVTKDMAGIWPERKRG